LWEQVGRTFIKFPSALCNALLSAPPSYVDWPTFFRVVTKLGQRQV